MNLADKKLIAEWMGWKVHGCYANTHITRRVIYNLNDFNPDTDRNVWPEIWKKMTYQQMRDYSEVYDRLMEIDYNELSVQAWVDIHTAPPDICCKTLLEVLKEQGGE